MRARQTDDTAWQCTKMAPVLWHYAIIYDIMYVNETDLYMYIHVYRVNKVWTGRHNDAWLSLWVMQLSCHPYTCTCTLYYMAQ